MANRVEIPFDKAQVKKAVQALQAFQKSKSKADVSLLDEAHAISLLFTLWKIPKKAQTIRIPLPHGQRLDTDEVCLFTRDEPHMTSDQTQRFYKRLLQEKGVNNIAEIIPYSVLKTEYKPHEAKRRLLGNYNMFLSDERVRRLLSSHLGKHFYQRKKEPLCVNLQSKNLARDVHRVIQGTSMKVSNRGCCCMARIGHHGMTTEQLTENIEAAIQTVAAKLNMKGPVVKLIHLKNESSVGLPLYVSNLNHLTELEEADISAKTLQKERAQARQAKKAKDAEPTGEKEVKEEEEEEEKIPMLVPIETPRKKPKLENASKEKLQEKAPKTAARKKARKAPNKRALARLQSKKCPK
uniref:Ribosomal L1 domain-containing protein 1 n=1 Tax=Gasterosteus aculeatus aculeatus TaxID=481459 RepID=A0AAQ4QAJ4_GASAC